MAHRLKIPVDESWKSTRMLHQALHGYADGHRLLESSMELAADSARTVLRMSDLSGSNVVNGFEEYITGYPLASLGFYALAKTWYAAEMPRPGCVWTHTLLIPTELLDRPSLSDLVGLFRRPAHSMLEGAYCQPLSNPSASGDTFETNVDERELASLVMLLYDEEQRPVIIPCKKACDYEQIILSIWSQQWPALRATLTFSTGSLEARVFGNRPFDIQCVPDGSLRDVELDVLGMQVGRPVMLNGVQNHIPDWALVSAKDALHPRGSALREFLWRCAEPSNRRSDFHKFIQVFVLAQNSPDARDLLVGVARLFPESNRAVRLKAEFFGEPDQRAFLRGLDEGELLSTIACLENHEAYDPESLGLRSRGQVLGKHPEQALRLVERLLRSAVNPLGAEILGGLVSAVDVRTAQEITNRHPRFLPALFAVRPSLAASPQLWAAAGDRRRELFETIVRQQNIEQSLIQAIIFVLLDSRSDAFFPRAFEIWGKTAVFAALNWATERRMMFPDSCRIALTYHIETIIQWVTHIEPNSSIPFAIIRVIAPYSYKLCEMDTNVWYRSLGEIRSNSDSDALYFSTFLLALALGNAPPTPLKLVAECFEVVYWAAWNEKLDDISWEILDPILPRLMWPNDWDKCERMRRGLIGAFIQHQWAASDLVRVIQNGEILSRLPRSAERIPGGEALLRRAAE